MANLNKTVVDKSVPFSGSFGNNSVAIMKVTLAAAQVADVVYFGMLPRGSYVHSVKLQNAALGSSGTLTLGYTPAEYGSTMSAVTNYWVTATSMASAAITNNVASAVPKLIAEDVYIVGVVAADVLTGDVYAIIEYEFQNQ